MQYELTVDADHKSATLRVVDGPYGWRLPVTFYSEFFWPGI
jgi:hypothetical protein